jgi:hypothetical protein
MSFIEEIVNCIFGNTYKQLYSDIQDCIAKAVTKNDIANRTRLVNLVIPVVKEYIYNLKNCRIDLCKSIIVFCDENINTEEVIKENKIAIEGRLYLFNNYCIEIFNEKFDI